MHIYSEPETYEIKDNVYRRMGDDSDFKERERLIEAIAEVFHDEFRSISEALNHMNTEIQSATFETQSNKLLELNHKISTMESILNKGSQEVTETLSRLSASIAATARHQSKEVAEHLFKMLEKRSMSEARAFTEELRGL